MVLYAVRTRLFLLNLLPSFEYFDFRPQSSTMSRTHLKGWHTRALAQPCPNPYLFVPQRENVKIARRGTIPSNTTASRWLYSPRTRNGPGLNLLSTSPDIKGLLDLGHQTPIANRFRNIWMIKDQMTSQPIDRFFHISTETDQRVWVFADPYRAGKASRTVHASTACYKSCLV